MPDASERTTGTIEAVERKLGLSARMLGSFQVVTAWSSVNRKEYNYVLRTFWNMEAIMYAVKFSGLGVLEDQCINLTQRSHLMGYCKQALQHQGFRGKSAPGTKIERSAYIL